MTENGIREERKRRTEVREIFLFFFEDILTSSG